MPGNISRRRRAPSLRRIGSCSEFSGACMPWCACDGKFVVFQDDAQTLLGVVNRGSPRLILNELARELFWFSLERRIVILVEWVPRGENSLADELSKFIIPNDWMLQRELFRQIEQRWGRHLADLFASNANN